MTLIAKGEQVRKRCSLIVPQVDRNIQKAGLDLTAQGRIIQRLWNFKFEKNIKFKGLRTESPSAIHLASLTKA